jgi:hypothetical protein
MRRVRADTAIKPIKPVKRGGWLAILVAAVFGFLLGDWYASPSPSRPIDLSASQNVALRFPETRGDAAPADIAADKPNTAMSTMVLGDAQLALLSPDPMVPLPAPSAARAPVQAAPQAATPIPAPKGAPEPSAPRAELKSAADSAARHAGRPGYMLNDAQIASIKKRLHLTPDQEAMWPAVEAALRNVAYARAREAHRHDALVNASADPDGIAVQDLKSAAIPLLMSFSDQQKNEVRSLAHVLGLDKLANEF